MDDSTPKSEPDPEPPRTREQPGPVIADPTRPLRATLRGIGTVVAPTSAVTALLYYFGWSRTNVQSHQLGLDDSLLGYTTQDYLLRSMSSMLAPLVIGVLATLVGLAAHAAIMAWARGAGTGSAGSEGMDPGRRRSLRRLAAGLAIVGAVALAVGGLGTRATRPSDFVYVASPICVTVGIVLVVYAANLYRRFLMGGDLERAAGELQGLHLVASGAVVMLLLLSLFWNVSHYAAIKGRNLAATVEKLLPRQPSVIVYSQKRLYLQPPVVETRLDPQDAAYNFAYTGLKLLFRSDRKYFLRPSDPSSQANIVIPDGLDIRLEFFKG